MRKNVGRSGFGFVIGRMAIATLLLSVASAAMSQETLTHSYDELGRLSSVTYPDGKKITYHYDAAGNRTQLVIALANQPPVAVNDSIFVSDSSGYSVTFDPRWNDTDPESNPLTVTSKTNGAKGTVTIQGGGTSVLYVFTATPPASDQYDSDSFTYTISDGNGGSAVGTVNVTVYTNCIPPPGQEFCEL